MGVSVIRQTLAEMNPMLQRFSTALAVCAAVALCACAHSGPAVVQLYEGPPRDKARIATIAEDSGTRTQVKEIDGEKAVGRSWEVLPGFHSVLARTSMSTNTREGDRLYLVTECRIRFAAKAGHDYVVTRRGDVERKRSGFYDFDLAAIVVGIDSPNQSEGLYDCEIVSGGTR